MTAAETADGKRFRAEAVVNTGNPKRQVNQMLDDPDLWHYKDRQVLMQAPVSDAVGSAFLGEDMTAEDLRPYLKDHHTHFWRSYETASKDPYQPALHRKGWSMISATSLNHPDLAPPGKSSLVTQVFTPVHSGRSLLREHVRRFRALAAPGRSVARSASTGSVPASG